MAKKGKGYLCDICFEYFESDDPIIAHGTKREMQFCSLKHKAKYLKMRNGNITTKDENSEKNS